jgi:hypothetical protein
MDEVLGTHTATRKLADGERMNHPEGECAFAPAGLNC